MVKALLKIIGKAKSGNPFSDNTSLPKKYAPKSYDPKNKGLNLLDLSPKKFQKVLMKIEKNVFLNSAYFAQHTPLTLVPPIVAIP